MYKIIYADPPWHYRDRATAGLRGAVHKYPVLSYGELAELDMDRIAADDCALFLWSTMPQLPRAIRLGTAWGFEYKTIAFVWVKRNKVALTWFWGMGNWTRANAEVVLLFTKGKPKRISAGVHSVLDTPRRRHSEKPAEVRDRIVDLMGDLPRVELFAREGVVGWDSLGYDIDGRDIRDILKRREFTDDVEK